MIYITGDCHGDFSKLLNNKFSNLTKDDYIIICGDFGAIWSYDGPNKIEKQILKELTNANFTTLFVDGNHENFDRLYKYPVINWNGGKVHKITNSVYHLMRGEIYTLDNKKIFAFGGASSHDIKDGILNIDEEERMYEYNKRHASYRIRNYDWWDLELPTKEEMDNGLNNLKKYNYKVDYIISHCCPNSIQTFINKYYTYDKLTSYFEEIKNNVEFKKWYFGHYHMNIPILDKYECLYDDIVEIR